MLKMFTTQPNWNASELVFFMLCAALSLLPTTKVRDVTYSVFAKKWYSAISIHSSKLTTPIQPDDSKDSNPQLSSQQNAEGAASRPWHAVEPPASTVRFFHSNQNTTRCYFHITSSEKDGRPSQFLEIFQASSCSTSSPRLEIFHASSCSTALSRLEIFQASSCSTSSARLEIFHASSCSMLSPRLEIFHASSCSARLLIFQASSCSTSSARLEIFHASSCSAAPSRREIFLRPDQ